MVTGMPVLNSCAEARQYPRIDQANSEPRRIAAFATDARGERAVDHAFKAAGVSVSRLQPGADGARPDLIVFVGSADGSVEHLASIYDQAGKLGVLVTGVVLTDDHAPKTGAAVDAMRRNTDTYIQTTDEDFLALMLHWLERSG